jgi:hypothetical protein
MLIPVKKLAFFPLMALFFLGLVLPNIYNVSAFNVNEICNNGRDDDGDTTIDEIPCVNISIGGIRNQADISIASITEVCLNGVDDDNDGEIDEPDCVQSTVEIEYCSNGIDDDNDGLVDAFDQSCKVVEICNNQLDDDNDGKIDERLCIVIVVIDTSSRTTNGNKTLIIDLMSSADTTGTTNNQIVANYPLESAADSQADVSGRINILTACPTLPPATRGDVAGRQVPFYVPNLGRTAISGTASINELVDALDGSMEFTLEVTADFADVRNPSISAALVPNSITQEPVELDSVKIDQACERVPVVSEKAKGDITPIPNTNTSADKSGGQQSDTSIIADRAVPGAPSLQTTPDVLAINPLTSSCPATDDMAKYRFVGRTNLLDLGDLDNNQRLEFVFLADFTEGKVLKISGTDKSAIAAQIAIDPQTDDAKIVTFDILKISTACTKQST